MLLTLLFLWLTETVCADRDLSWRPVAVSHRWFVCQYSGEDYLAEVFILPSLYQTGYHPIKVYTTGGLN